jgi:hypothetical protein
MQVWQGGRNKQMGQEYFELMAQREVFQGKRTVRPQCRDEGAKK